ncbi:hypothetical protein CDV31_001173 [Fusarium ambrosium]|uniref:RNA helicase n=1 Tax=Fusarium ambrosium TaxID=131363 RepID=A0A428V0M7_9HYPO|nr:hypothetical protein CDV31_001173 [Fusarium ambrosium]
MESAQAQQNQPVPADSLRRNQTTARGAMRLEDGHGLTQSRSWLPICQEEARQEFLDTCHASQVTIFVGGTSCGKTIQVFKFTLFDKWEGGLLELNVDLGDEMVDETHERTKNTDLLLALLKQAMGMQPGPKVVVMSATVDSIIFTRSSPREATPDFRKAMIKAVAGVAQTKPKGSSLAFMASIQQIEETSGLIRKKVPGLQVMPLYSSLSRAQMEGVRDTNTGRKCSVSTNVAEASLTISGITFMIGNERQSVDH